MLTTNKKYFYVSSLPRSGQTLLASLLHQNKEICFGPQSVAFQMIYELAQIKTYSPIYNNFPAAEAYDYAVFNVFNNFYEKFTDAKYVLDRAPWGIKYNRNLLSFFEDKPKFIIMYRPALECLASLIKVEKPNLDIPVYTRCKHLLNPGGAIHKGLQSIKEIIENKEDHIIIHYKDLIKDPTAVVRKVYDYIGIPFKGVRLTNLDQYEVKGVKYYDHKLDGIPHQGLHTIRTDKIEQIKYDIKEYIPQEIIDQYKNIDVL